ncbi:MAG: hypothetical protein GY854_31685 [Deltaproteobacteria bacterium]|nr:hypothetical protein [Deltaproteobacteria bacterium]
MSTKRLKKPLRAVIGEIMEPYRGGPGSTKLSLIVDLFVLSLIIVSCVLIPVEIIYPEHLRILEMVDFCITAIFLIEYMLRWYSAKNRIVYPFTGYAIIDLVAILPSIILFASHLRVLRLIRGIRILRILRLLRLVRILRFFRFGHLISHAVLHARINLSSFAYRYRLGNLFKLFVITCVIWIIAANVLYYTETSLVQLGLTSYVTDAPPSGPGFYSDYWHSYWNIIILLISGIEDKEPFTVLGRIEATIVLIAGIVIIGLLTGEIVSVLVRRLQRMGLVKEMPPRKGLFEQHIVILGINRHLDNIIRHINDAVRGHHFILVIHPDAETLPIMDSHNYSRVFALAGDPSDKRTLDKASLGKAARIIILSPEDCVDKELKDNQTLMVTIAAAVRPRKEDIPTVVEIIDDDNLNYANILHDVEYINGKQCCERLTSQAVLNPGVTEVYTTLLNFSLETNEIYIIPVPRELLGKTFKEVQLHFLDLDDEDIIPIGVERVSEDNPNTKPVFYPGVAGHGDDPLTLGQGDRLVVIAYDRPACALIDENGKWSPTYLARASEKKA